MKEIIAGIVIALAIYLIPLVFIRTCVIGYWWVKFTEKGKTYGWMDFYETLYEKNPRYVPGIGYWENEKKHPSLIASWEIGWVPLVNVFYMLGWMFMLVIWVLMWLGFKIFCGLLEFYDRHEQTIITSHFCWWKPFSRFAWKVTYPVRIILAGICEGILWCWDRYRNIRITR